MRHVLGLHAEILTASDQTDADTPLTLLQEEQTYLLSNLSSKCNPAKKKERKL